VASTAEANICWTPRSAVWFAESWDAGDQIGGDSVNHISISLASDMVTEGGSWFATAFNASNACNYFASYSVYHCDVTGSRALDIWTDR
jgi:hypothetical protein